MRRIGALLFKEWRDQRALVLLAAALVASVVFGARAVFGDAVDSELRTRWILPASLVLFLAAVSADSAAHESNEGVGDALGRLPIRAGALWSAKLAFLLLAGLAFQAWLMLLELAARWVSPEEAPPAFLRPDTWGWAAASAGAVLAFATVLRRPFPAAFLGLGTVIGAPFAVSYLPSGAVRDWLLVAIDPWSPAWMAGVVGAAFVLASLGAYSPWCARGSHSHRHVLPSLLGFALVLGPAVGGSALWARGRIDLVPEKMVKGGMLTAHPSPDGRFVAIQAHTDFRFGWRDTDHRPPFFREHHDVCEVWILDRRDGSLRTIDGRTRSVFQPPCNGRFSDPWDEDGMLRTVSSAGPFLRSEPFRMEVVDPFRGTVVSHASIPANGGLSAFESGMELERWCELEPTSGGRFRAHWIGREETALLPADSHPTVSPEPGVIFHENGSGDLVRRDLRRGSARVLATFEGRVRTKVSTDGRWLFVRQPEQVVLLDSSTGAELFRSTSAYFPVWSRSPGRVCYMRSESGWSVIEEERGERRLDLPSWVEWLSDLGPDALLGGRLAPARLAALDLEGHVVEMLYESKEAAGRGLAATSGSGR